MPYCALLCPTVPTSRRDPPLCIPSTPTPNMPCIVDLSLESEDDDCFIKENDCYIYPSKRHPPAPKPLLMHTVRTPVSIRKPRALSSSSSSVISLVSPPRKPPVQARITTFFESPSKKGKSIKLENTRIEKAFNRVAPPRPSRIPSPVARSVFFRKSELFVDDNEAPVPSAFDGPIDEGTFECPMEIDSNPPAVVLPPSGPVCPEPRPFIVPANMSPVLQRDRPVMPLPSRRERPVAWMSPHQPREVVVTEPELESSEFGGTLLPAGSEVTAEVIAEVTAEMTVEVTVEAEVVATPGESSASAGLPVQTGKSAPLSKTKIRPYTDVITRTKSCPCWWYVPGSTNSQCSSQRRSQYTCLPSSR